jgi:type I restriction enzyme S subunit
MSSPASAQQLDHAASTRVPLGKIARVLNGGTPTPDSENWDGEIPWATPVDLNAADGHQLMSTERTLTPQGLQTGSTLAPVGSVLLSTRAPIGYATLAGMSTSFNQGCKAIVPGSNVHGPFLLRLVQAGRDELISLGQGSTFQELSTSALKSYAVPLPDLPRQIAVATFLDRETGEIDAFIRDQEGLIRLLQERRAAMVSHAVSKGLNPGAPQKASASDWFGAVPSHWSVASLRRVLDTIEQGVSPQAEAGPAGEGETGVLKSGCVNDGIFREHEHKKLPDDFSYPPSIVVRPGDLLMNRASGSLRLLGSAAIVDHLTRKLILSDKTFRLRPIPSKTSTQFLNAVLNSTPIRRQIESSVSGAEGLAKNLPMSSIRRLEVPVPPLQEQSEIVNYLRDALDEVDLTIRDARRAVTLSLERRSSLISAAVAGKIDVSEHTGV